MPATNPIDKILKRIEKLPTLPTVLHQILELTASPDSSADDLIRVITVDQSLTANLLKVANSPIYGIPYRIESAKQAVVLLGFNEVRNIALSASVFASLNGPQNLRTFSRDRFWQHSFLVAHLTREMYALFPDPRMKTLYFTAGILHDIGIVVLDRFFQIEFADIIDTIEQERLIPVKAEMRYLGVTHAEIGGALLHRWQLPENLVSAVREHHTPWAIEEERPLLLALYYANLLAKLLGYAPYTNVEPSELGDFYQSTEAIRLDKLGLLLEQKVLDEWLERYRRDEEKMKAIMEHAAALA